MVPSDLSSLFCCNGSLNLKCRQNHVNANKPRLSLHSLNHRTALFSVFSMLRHTQSTSLRLQVFYGVCLCAASPLVAWRNTLEDWAPEDWSEDVSVSQMQTVERYLAKPSPLHETTLICCWFPLQLSETKVFTSSCAPAAENHITPGQRSVSQDSTTQLQ